MTTTGHLDLGAAKIIDLETGADLGYAYTVATPTGQLQRWLLYRNPNNSFKVQAPPAHMAGWSLSDWQANVPELWTAGAFYVRANADVYRYGESYGGVQWTRIPEASDLPDPSYPEGPIDHQLDPILKLIQVKQDDIVGLAYTLNGLSDISSVEYWLLPASYKPAGARSSASIAVGAEAMSSLDQFVDRANRSFQPGSSFVITGCVNYNGASPPGLL